MAGRPYIDFYVGDWRKALDVSTLTLEEKGAWLEIVFWMHESEDRGKLVLNGEALNIPQIAGILGVAQEKAEEISEKLISSGVAEFDPKTRTLYCRRMVREEELRQHKVNAGRKGGEASAKQRQKSVTSKTQAALDNDIDTDSDIDNDVVIGSDNEIEGSIDILVNKVLDNKEPKKEETDLKRWCHALYGKVKTRQAYSAHYYPSWNHALKHVGLPRMLEIIEPLRFTNVEYLLKGGDGTTRGILTEAVDEAIRQDNRR